MTPTAKPLPAGLHLVATPIGAARDITLRALDTLAAADVLVAEDTRTLRRLLDIHGIAVGGRPLLSYHDHSKTADRDRLVAMIAEGRSVAYASEAGTPLIADPGYRLAGAVIENGGQVLAVPGPSAVLAALAVAGLPTDRFLFAGFPPSGAGPRRRFLAEIAEVPATLVLYESPKRLNRLFPDLVEVLGQDRQAALCRELTKRFEEVRRGTLGELAAGLAETAPKGEIVLVIDRPDTSAAARVADLDAALVSALDGASMRDAVQAVATALGLPRKQVYQRALELQAEGRP